MGQEPEILLVRPTSRQHPRCNTKRTGKGGQPKPATVFAADTNSCTLSRQSENIAAVRVELGGCGGLQWASKGGKVFLRGAAGQRNRTRHRATTRCCRLRQLSSTAEPRGRP